MQKSQQIRFNDKFSQKCTEFVGASSIHINEIKRVKYQNVLLAKYKGKFNALDDRDVMEILKYI
jgi:hypothetical protein